MSENKCNNYNMQYEEHVWRVKLLHINVLLLYAIRKRK